MIITPSQVLRRAADLLERDGWCQGIGHAPDGSRCAIGALRSVVAEAADCTDIRDTLDYGRWLDAADAADAGLRHYLNDHTSRWNDEPGRTAAEVVATLRAVADQLDGADPVAEAEAITGAVTRHPSNA